MQVSPQRCLSKKKMEAFDAQISSPEHFLARQHLGVRKDKGAVVDDALQVYDHQIATCLDARVV